MTFPSRRAALALLSAMFIIVGFAVYLSLMRDFAITGSSDSTHYDALGTSLAAHGIYSLDGVTPFFEREPGYPVFLAILYALFGLHAYGAVFLVQGLLYLFAVLAFDRAMRKVVPPRASLIAVAILLFSPAVYHSIFAILRESLALSLALLFTACAYEAWSRRSYGLAALAGALLGYLILTYAALLLLPFFLCLALLIMRFPWRQGVLLFLVAFIVIAPWGIRNYAHRGELCLTGCTRAALQWYVRGEQAETLRGAEPFRCLWAEYVTRNYEGRNPNCHFNAVMYRKWPEGFKGTEEDRLVGKAGQAKILAHFGWYLWGSVAEVLELHLPYVNGWGRTYNLLALSSTVFVYLGCLLALPFIFRRKYALLLAFIPYFLGVFALTDALPRYLVPAIFCYVFLASIGYHWLLSRLFQRARL
jgi:4-amino-4-deoxy-L-arabinose transferase-like glycosyltransferase